MLVLTYGLKKYHSLLAVLLLGLANPLLAQISITDSHGTQVFETPPTRVAALNWEMAENVIELGIEPVAIADAKGYQEWVAKPAIPASTQDIGDRAEPNLSKLAELKPDVILIGSALKSMQSRLEKIAPVVFFESYRKDHNNAEQVDNTFLSLAKLLNKEAQAKQKLAHRAQVIAQLKQQLNEAYPNGLPKVTSLRFASTTSVYAYGENAMPQYALEALGVENALTLKRTQWGVVQKKIRDLRAVEENTLLYFQPFYEEDKLNASPLWQAMPFVQAGKVNSVDSTWTYGGAMSLQYLAESMAAALLELAN